jgi:hypothetical protein
MNGEKAKASAQYNDLEGTVAADWRDNTNRLNDFAQSQAVDLQGYIPVGIWVRAPGVRRTCRTSNQPTGKRS